MIRLPRLALATSSQGAEPALANLALLAGLTDRRWRVQYFRSWACPTGTEAVEQITGMPGRHLDTWLMPPDVCRRVFVRGASRADLTVVEGTLDEDPTAPDQVPCNHPGPIGPLAEALDLPLVSVLDCPRLERLHLPRLSAGIDAILIDGLEDRAEFDAIRRVVSLALNKPVIGAVEALPDTRQAIRDAHRLGTVPKELFDLLGASFLRFADLATIKALAESRPMTRPDEEPRCGTRRRFRVAYAQDGAFGGYFPDTLETLEGLGAELVEFSPLCDEALPEGADLVMIGCGFPDRHADALAENLSLISALRSHVCQGRRIYSEGGGTAYLGRYMVLDGRFVRGAGILPFDAELLNEPQPPRPVSRVLERDGWLGPKGTTVRGYRSGRWRLRPAPEPNHCPGNSGVLTHQGDIYFRHHAVGSLIHLHLGALPQVVAAFADPHQPSLSLP
jgi:cobyrinic acid a,c-diamide synthase